MSPPQEFKITRLANDYDIEIGTISSSVYSQFSDRVGLPPHNIPFPRVLMKSIGAVFLRPDAFPDVNHMRGMQYKIVLNIIFLPEITAVQICVYNFYTKQQH